jgi:hypothetical protein
VSSLQRYIETFGPEAGPKIHHAIRSRAAYKGVSTRRRHRIEELTGHPYRLRRRSSAARGQGVLPLTEPAAADGPVPADQARLRDPALGLMGAAGSRRMGVGDGSSGDGTGNAE